MLLPHPPARIPHHSPPSAHHDCFSLIAAGRFPNTRAVRLVYPLISARTFTRQQRTVGDKHNPFGVHDDVEMYERYRYRHQHVLMRAGQVTVEAATPPPLGSGSRTVPILIITDRACSAFVLNWLFSEEIQ